MTKSFRRNVSLATGALILSVSLPVMAEVIYDNTLTDLNTRFNPGASEVGDQIVLEKTGWLTNFSFEYYATSTSGTLFAGNVEAQVKFYRMDGAPVSGYASPGSSFYDSGWFTVPAPTTRSTMNFTAGSDFAPGGLALSSKDMTWSVAFRGMGSGDVVGLDLFTAPASAPGFNYPDYWINESGSWVLKEGSGTVTIPIDFAAKFEANIPEPTSLTLLALGAVSMFFVRRNRR